MVPAVADLGLCVIGCGNLTRSDDGVGVYVAQALRAYLGQNPRDNVAVFDAGTGGMEVMFQARGASRLIIVDASKSGSEAGAIFKVPGRELESEPDPGYSLHDFRWQHALSAGRKIFGDDFPEDVTVYLIEAASLAYGLELTAPVTASATRVAEEIRGIILAHANQQDRAAADAEGPAGAAAAEGLAGAADAESPAGGAGAEGVAGGAGADGVAGAGGTEGVAGAGGTEGLAGGAGAAGTTGGGAP